MKNIIIATILFLIVIFNNIDITYSQNNDSSFLRPDCLIEPNKLSLFEYLSPTEQYSIADLSFESSKIVIKHLLFLASSSCTIQLKHQGILMDSWSVNEFLLGCNIGWKEIIHNSETELLQKLFWGEKSILIKKHNRFFPIISPDLLKAQDKTDPRNNSRKYKNFPNTESFYTGILYGRLIASNLFSNAYNEASRSIRIKNNEIYIQDLRSDSNSDIKISVAILEFTEAEKKQRYKEAPSLEAICFLKFFFQTCASSTDVREAENVVPKAKTDEKQSVLSEKKP